jgi:hypothetical protein
VPGAATSDTSPVLFVGGAWHDSYSELLAVVLDGREVQRRVGVVGTDFYRFRGEWRDDTPPGSYKVPGVLMEPRPRRRPVALLRHERFAPRSDSPLK